MKAVFINRNECITCGGRDLQSLSKGKFTDEPLYGYLSNDPWGVSPIPFIDEEQWDFVQCNDCFQKFHKRILNEEWLQTYYSKWISADAIEEYHKEISDSSKFEKAKHSVERVLLIEKATRKISENKAVNVLDFGCGDGDFLEACQLFGFKCTGVEFSESRYQRRGIDFYPSLQEAIEGNGNSAEFDAMVMFEVLEHLPNPRKTLADLVANLKKGGVFILETPNCTNVKHIVTMEDYRLIHPLGHINAFTPETMKKIANQVGLVPFAAGTPQVSADYKRIMKREVRRLLERFRSPKTQMFFQKR
ncbi:MAG: class I SAM-dependent methyltransferase [Candidatus Electrothrix sp. AW3_4]|jgi:2-polyprenyl-3-methyl-5-hydroxy-6-metoxy-1,4-benzoquinol methylase|nr:class I SAM-dependent methyltransferase [Candidatus Electrothrix gigas]